MNQRPADVEMLGRHVRRSRGFVGIGQRALAARANVSQTTIARLELGRAGGLAAYRLVEVASVLGRAFPFGACPHVHRCAWQPIEMPPPPTEQDVLRELVIDRGLDTPRPLWMRD